LLTKHEKNGILVAHYYTGRCISRISRKEIHGGVIADSWEMATFWGQNHDAETLVVGRVVNSWANLQKEYLRARKKNHSDMQP